MRALSDWRRLPRSRARPVVWRRIIISEFAKFFGSLTCCVFNLIYFFRRLKGDQETERLLTWKKKEKKKKENKENQVWFNRLSSQITVRFEFNFGVSETFVLKNRFVLVLKYEFKMKPCLIPPSSSSSTLKCYIVACSGQVRVVFPGWGNTRGVPRHCTKRKMDEILEHFACQTWSEKGEKYIFDSLSRFGSALAKMTWSHSASRRPTGVAPYSLKGDVHKTGRDS